MIVKLTDSLPELKARFDDYMESIPTSNELEMTSEEYILAFAKWIKEQEPFEAQ